MKKIAVISSGKFPEGWAHGPAWSADFTPRGLHAVIRDKVLLSDAEAVLFWDSSWGDPDATLLQRFLERPIEVFHSGLKLGTAGLPQMLDFVHPTWMFNRDADPEIESSSWRLSFRACLIRTEVFRQLGNIDPEYDTLESSALDFGLRLIRLGVFTRHTPLLIRKDIPGKGNSLSVYDELRFIMQQYGFKWTLWSMGRGLAHRFGLLKLIKAFFRIRRQGTVPLPPPYKRKDVQEPFNPQEWHGKVTVLIPTLERYSYLRNELEQLRAQTVKPKEIIITDQTPLAERETGIDKEFSDLPIKVIYQDTMGQCTAWNAALQAGTGEYFLFLGDDADRIKPDFIESFFRCFARYNPDMVVSVVEEKNAGPLPFSLGFMRISDIYSISMVRRNLFYKTGLFDFAYDRGSRADADLGLRFYLNGAMMILDPTVQIFHHRAPRGGLRKHGARVTTFTGSRSNLRQRELPSVTEVYFTKRHYTRRQEKEMLYQAVLGTFSYKGKGIKKILKGLFAIFFLVDTLFEIRKRGLLASSMLNKFPQIPSMEKEGA